MRLPDQVVSVRNFGGLDLVSDPEDVGGERAVDSLNVDPSIPGRCATRHGYSKFNSNTVSATGYHRLVPQPAGLVLLRSTAGSIALDTAGPAITNIGSWGAANTVATSVAQLGTPTSSRLYVASSNAATAQTLQYYDGAAIAASVGKPQRLGVLPASNRLVQGCYNAAGDSPSGADGSRSTVFFSDAGAPDTYGANNFVQLRPGDNESITEIVTWRDLCFVFKRTSLFVFYGTATGGSGNPTFNYRDVSLPMAVYERAVFGSASDVAVAGSDGVYFLSPQGIYRTTGGTPVLVSKAITPIFDGTAPAALAWNGDLAKLSWANERLYMTYTNANSAARTLVWDLTTGAWAVWDLAPGTNVAQWAPSVTVETSYPFFSVGNDIYSMRPTFTTDAGVAIPWSWTSGLSDLGFPGQVKISREHRMTGIGTVTLKIGTTGGVASTAGVLDTGSAVVLGSSVADEGWQQIDREGSLWQYQLSGSGQASVSRLDHFLPFVKVAGLE